MKRRLLLSLFGLALAACQGSGGPNSSGQAPPPNPVPVCGATPCPPGYQNSKLELYMGKFTITNTGLYAAFMKEYTSSCNTGFWGGGSGSPNNCYSYFTQSGTAQISLPATLTQGAMTQVALATQNPGTWAPGIQMVIYGYFYAQNENQGFSIQAPGRSGFPGTLSWNKTFILDALQAPIDPATGRLSAGKFDFVLYYKSKYGKQEMARGTAELATNGPYPVPQPL